MFRPEALSKWCFGEYLTHLDIEYTACSLGDLKNARMLPGSGIEFGTQWFKDIVKMC